MDDEITIGDGVRGRPVRVAARRRHGFTIRQGPAAIYLSPDEAEELAVVLAARED